jgi:CheY-like chemotaxis protein
MLTGQPTVLIVDDEELLRDVTSIMIEDHGGKALTAEDGQKGVEIFSANPEKIDLVLVDFSMPNMNGFEALQKMRQIRPSVKAIMVSGLSITPEVAALQASKEVFFMSKPFREAELVNAINTMLGSGSLA